MGTLTRVTQGSDDRIAITRTLAPALWTMIVSFVVNNFGIDVNERLATFDGDGGVSGPDVAKVASFLIFAGLYLLGRYRPELERLLLGVAVDRTSYVTTGEAKGS